jgi:ubiquinone/menaquinone biosynthesis C-methylase UbiE
MRWERGYDPSVNPLRSSGYDGPSSKTTNVTERAEPHSERIDRETRHADVLLKTAAISRPWTSAAGRIRKERRVAFLTRGYQQLPAHPKVLEIGCGTGIFTEEIARTFSDLTSIDVVDALLEVARQRLPQVRIENADVHHLIYASGSFDLVLGCSILHHLDWDAALAEIGRVLKPLGQVRFCEPNLLNPQILVQKNWPWLKRKLGDSPDEYAFTPRQITASLESQGFTDISVQPFEFLHPATPRALVGAVLWLESLLSQTPLVRIGGTLKIAAFKRDSAFRK